MSTEQRIAVATGSGGLDARRLGMLYAAHHPALVRFLTRLTRCPSGAEDLAQATWLKLLAHPGLAIRGRTDDTELRAYLFAAARNLFLDEYTRKHGRTRTRCVAPEVLDAAAGPAGPHENPEQHAAQQQLGTHVRNAVATLSAEQRTVIAMWVHGVPLREMSAHARAPVDTVLSRKKYAFARMRRALAPHVQAAIAG